MFKPNKNCSNFVIETNEKALRNELFNLEIFSANETIREKELIVISSHMKRCIERWQADSDFRGQVPVDPYKAAVRYGLKVNPEEIRPLWEQKIAKNNYEQLADFPAVKIYRKYIELFKPLERILSMAASINEPHFKSWRERQIIRAASQFRRPVHEAVQHFPICFELSKGCSVGCWFCGVSAPRLGDIFIYSQENAKLWREVLELIKEILGPAAGSGFCYWATDPLDNPDYEKFCSDFHEVLGVFPQTTTAQPLKDPARTRALLKLSMQKGCLLNRFSILSLKMFNQVHDEFSSEELAFVRLVFQNQESISNKANTGRARKRNISKSEKDSKFDQETIACVTGFLFSMVDRSVKLISPCIASSHWPLGYKIYDEGRFSNVKDLKILLERMIVDNMPITVKPNHLIKFRSDLEYESIPNGFQLSTNLKTYKFHNETYLSELGEMIHEGSKTAKEIAFSLENRGISSAHTFHTFNLMLQRGVLDDEPKPKSLETKV